MGYIQYILILALPLVRTAVLQSVKTETLDKNNITSVGCDHPFQIVNEGCYFFSDFQLDFDQAVAYCKSLEHGHMYEISLAMLDYNKYEDQAVLNAVADKENTFWLGGNTVDGNNWYWVDGRVIDVKSPFWKETEPNFDANTCMAAETVTFLNTLKRAYAYDHDCSDPLNFICKTGDINCPIDFIKIGNYCYMQSWNIGVPELHWTAARDYCRSLNVPNGFHTDLAVLGLEDQDDYFLINNLIPDQLDNAWIGAYRNETCDFSWIDGRELALESIYWYSSQPDCDDGKYVTLRVWTAYSTKYLLEWNPTYSYPFICQMF